MKSPLHILHLEDNPNDALLIQATLKSEGIACETTCVQTRDKFVASLEHGGVDLILSDFSLPAFDGLSATEIVRSRWPAIPLILVSGSLGEERAIDSLKSGATDYVLKERLSRLAPAVRRAMHEVEALAESKRLEGLFVEAQKMEVVGHLASGIAHDFNNILAVIIGYSGLMQPELAPDSLAHKCAEEIHEAAGRATALTRQLLVFSRQETVHPVVLDLNEVIDGVNKMLRRLVDENVALAILPEKQLGRVKADPNQIGQILMNLVVNARDAMPKGGQLTITTANVTLAADYVRTHPEVTPGDYVMLSVTDTGTGIADAIKPRLFEAFFTTKPRGQGTGLGLATCRTIVKQSGGHITVDSEWGRGATFKVYLPRVEQPLDVDTTLIKKGPLPRGTETLLLVEDDPSVRHLACSILEAQGYTMLRANNGQEGLNMVREHKGPPIRLVITDVIMPQMGGKVMAEWLQATYPEIRILFTSGYTNDALAQHGVLAPGLAFLPKPYTPAALAGKVRELLDPPENRTPGEQ